MPCLGALRRPDGFFVACSKANASAISRGSLHGNPTKATPFGDGLGSNPCGNSAALLGGTGPIRTTISGPPIEVGRQLRIMARAALGYVPFIGWHLQRGGHLLVNRKNPGAGIFKLMQRMTRHGASLIVFPEGSRTSDGRLMKFKGGIFLLAIEIQWPVVPVSVSGTRVVMPKGRLTVCPAEVTVTVHPPIETTGLTRDDARGLAERVKGIVAAGVPG